MGLTKHQEIKADEILRSLRTQGRAVLNGSAGVGKTYLADHIIKQMRPRIAHNKKIYVSAPTNKAVAVIKSKVTQISGLEFVTTHSALRMKRQIDRATGEVSFKSYASEKYPALKDVKLLVIDEASMLNEEMMGYVEEYATQQGCSVLFIGDDKQLPPVNENVSKVFHAGYPTSTLTEIIRQGEGNPIIELSRDLKRIWSKEDYRTDIGGYIYSHDRGRVIETLAAVNGTDYLKYLAWTNNDVNSLNKQVRFRLYGENPQLVELGESLIFDAPYGQNKEGGSLFFTNEEVKVEELEVRPLTVKYPVKSNNITGEYERNTINLKVYSINPGMKDTKDGVVVVHEDSMKDYNAILRQMKSNCKARVLEWTDYFRFMEEFAQVKYNHAITVHKSQGSTYNQAIINVRDLNRNRKKEEKEKLFYTGVTRAS